MHVIVPDAEFTRLLATLGQPPIVAEELRCEIAAVRRRHPSWFLDPFPPAPPGAAMREPAPYLSPAEREFLEGGHAGRY